MSRVTLLALQLLVAVVALALWQLLTTVPVFGSMLLPPFFFSNPVDVFSQIIDWFSTGVIWKHLVDHAVGIDPRLCDRLARRRSGRLLVRAPAAVAAVFDPYVKMANALPRVVLAPIFTLWLGLGIWSKVALGVTLVFFIVFFNVYQGVKEVSTTVLDNGRMLGMSERQLMRHVYWPSALSWMFSSLHTSVGFAVVGAVVGEYLGSAAGLGYLIQQAEGVFDVAGVFAGMFVLSAFVILIDIGGDAGRAAAAGLAAGRGGGARVVLTPSFRAMARSTRPGISRFRVRRLRTPRNDGCRRQFSSLMSSGACGGVLIAIALMVRPFGLVPPCGVPFGMMTRSPGLTVHFLVAEPDRAGAFEDVLDLVGVGMQVLGRRCRPGSKWWRRRRTRTSCCACRRHWRGRARRLRVRRCG